MYAGSMWYEVRSIGLGCDIASVSTVVYQSSTDVQIPSWHLQNQVQSPRQ
jgi:hypothetical protein